jgi:hypothetical protein
MSSTMLDSEPVFRDRMKAIGVSDAFQLALIAAGITTLARLAFSSASMPGSGDDSAFVGFLVGIFALLLKLTFLQGIWHAFEGLRMKLTPYLGRTSDMD